MGHYDVQGRYEMIWSHRIGRYTTLLVTMDKNRYASARGMETSGKVRYNTMRNVGNQRRRDSCINDHLRDIEQSHNQA